ncbi:hypothetical protein [Brachybacterium sp. YJGR34]|uniref:hypothetical protein n=1 Tax=Brachybacterium sp. YJGR34 TaxID=2059911 RepID=UPI00130069D4|nr:hypothetical protein [Brachybacterium sp. YJGR34]
MTRIPARERPPRTTMPRVLATLGLTVLSLAGMLAVAFLVQRRDPLLFLGMSALELVLLAAALGRGLSWLRATRATRPFDALPLVILLGGAGAALWFVPTIAGNYGIRGSALPRVRSGTRHGVPLAFDLAYLLAVGLSLATLAILALTAALMILRTHAVRRGLTGGRDRALEAAEQFVDPGTGRDKDPAPPRTVTSASDGFLRRNLPPVSRVLMVLGATTSLVCVLVVALARPAPELTETLTEVAVFAPVPAMLWAQLASLWRRDEELGNVMATIYRSVTVPPVVAALCAVPTLLVGLLPPVWTGFAEHTAAVLGENSLARPGAPAPVGAAFGALVATAAGMLGGLFISVFIVMPSIALFRPGLLFGANDLSTEPAYRRANIASVRALSALLVGTFVFAALMATSDPGDARRWWAMAVLLVVALLTAFVWRTQRVDHARRAESGTQSLIPGPHDPRPQDGPEDEGGSEGPSASPRPS